MHQVKSLGFVDNICTNEVFGKKLYRSVYHQAAAYLYYISNRHIFHDGNKRTGLAVALTFLTWNGFTSGHLPEEDSYQFVVGIASSQDRSEMVINRIAAWLETLTQSH